MTRSEFAKALQLRLADIKKAGDQIVKDARAAEMGQWVTIGQSFTDRAVKQQKFLTGAYSGLSGELTTKEAAKA